MIYRALYIPGGAGFCPSTVSKHVVVNHDISFLQTQSTHFISAKRPSMHESDKFCAFLLLSFFFFLGFCSFTGCFPAFSVNETSCMLVPVRHALIDCGSTQVNANGNTWPNFWNILIQQANFIEQYRFATHYRAETNKVWNNTAHQVTK